MFCLRSWIPILFFLTNASPVYLILFISATYVLNRPCVYCSLLLAILVVALFDFRSDWFEPQYMQTNPALPSGNSTQHDSMIYNASFGFMNSLSLFGSAMNDTAAGMLSSVASSLGSKAVAETSSAVNVTMVEWVRGILRKEWRISCLDVVIRL